MKIRHLSLMTAITIVAIAGNSSCKKSDKGQGEQMIPEYAVITVGEEDATLQTGFPTTLEGENDIEIRPQISGFLTKVAVEEGQRVNAGQTLFIIDQVQLQAAVDAAEAAVKVAQANVNTAQTSATNNKMLLDKNIISPSAYQTSEDALNAAKAQLSQANANLVSARKNLSYSVVKAPQAGIVGTIDYKEGTLVSPSTLLTILSNDGDMEANFSLNEKDLLALTKNGTINTSEAIKSMPEVSLELANGEIYPYKGRIESISGVINPTTGSANAKAIFPNPNRVLRSGNSGKVLIPNIHQNAILIPQSSTYEVQDMKFCYVVGDSNKVHSTPITVAEQNDGKSYIVTSGLKNGDVVVVEGVGISVKDNMVISPKK